MIQPILLIVDDVPINLEIVRAQCEALGLGCIVANNAFEALGLLMKHDFEMILTDISMPGMDGVEFAGRARQVRGGRIPVVGLTTTPMDQTPPELDEIVVKPMELSRLEELVDRYVHGRISADTAAEGSASLDGCVDMARLARLLGSESRDDLVEWLVYFECIFPALLDELKAELDRGDREEVARAAHKAKGAARSAAAMRLAQCLASIEMGAATAPRERMDDDLAEAEAEFARVRAFVANLG